MNKRYKPKKPIKYDTDRSLLHAASESMLGDTGKSVIIGQPTCYKERVIIGTEQVQVGTEQVQIGTKTKTVTIAKNVAQTRSIQIKDDDGVTRWHTQVIANIPGIYAIFQHKIINTVLDETRIECPVGVVTEVAIAPVSSTDEYKQFIKENKRASFDVYVYLEDKLRTVTFSDGPSAHLSWTSWNNKNIYEYVQVPVYEERPIYEERPVYEESSTRGLIMYLRRKGA